MSDVKASSCEAEMGDEVTEEEELFECKYCEFRAENVEDLDEHIVSHEEALLEDHGDEEEPEHSCEESAPNNEESIEISFETEKRKRGRKKIKQELPAYYDECAKKSTKKVLVCPFCGYQSMKKLDMNRHLKGHREPVELPVYCCAECPYTTRRKCDMPKHLLTHCEKGSVPMYQCNECPYSTKRKGDLTKHMLCHTRHTPNIYSCSECPYFSKRPGDLKKHLVIHNDGGPNGCYLYNCTECGYTSKRLNDLHKHVILHSDKTVKGMFKCTKCDYTTTLNNPFAKHILSNCQFRDSPDAVPVLPKDAAVLDYVVLDEDKMQLYQLDKGNFQYVDPLTYANSKKRKTYDDADGNVSLKNSYYEEGDKNKVVVLTGYENNNGAS